MKQSNPDPEQRSSKMWNLFFGSTVTGLVNDLDNHPTTIHDISRKRRLESDKTSDLQREEALDNKDE